MSSGLECTHLKWEGRWYYFLQRYDCPVGAWDWREYAASYGPFVTEDESKEHLHRWHANPGGAWIVDYDEDGRKPDEMDLRLIAEARR